MLKKLSFFLTVGFLAALTSLSAQVEKKVIVEHFTNSRCSVCASRNPGFFTNLESHPNVLHIAIHPSSPYSNCLLNNNNPEENDARTNYYGIYGSTPKLVIQGETVAVNENYGSAEIFAPYLNETSPVSMNIVQITDGETGVKDFNLEIKTEAENDLSDLELFVALVEDTVFYDAPNGEDLHFNVFRKRLIPTDNSVELPAVGEILSFNSEFEVEDNWNGDRLFVIAILQRADTKEVIQAAETSENLETRTSNLPILQNVEIFPNPVQNNLQVSVVSDTETNFRLLDVTGKLLAVGIFQSQTQLDMSGLTRGIYFIELENEEGRLTQKIIKE